MKEEDIKLKPCPFCGFQVDRYGLDDVLYPTGIFWREHPNPDVGREYIGHTEQIPTDHPCYTIICNVGMGGCDASMEGDSVEDVVEKWNTRVDK